MAGSALYEVGLAAVPHDPRPEELTSAIQALVADLGAERFATVAVKNVAEVALDVPTVAIVFWDDGLSQLQIDALEHCRSEGVTVLPIVPTTVDMPQLPPSLSRLNAIGWDGGAVQTARVCLRELGLCEPVRGVFISHRRSDGLDAAEQLFEAFAKAGWRPFVDRFDIDAGDDVQERIDEALEEAAFLLLLETPSASTSPWVQHEVLYALEHHLGLAIVNIDSATEFAATGDLPRHALIHATHMNGTHIVLSEDAVDEVVELVERSHAIALARRRRQLLVSAMAAAVNAGHTVDAVPGWRLQVQGAGRQELVGVLPHLPVPQDLYDIDLVHADDGPSVLVHAAHVINSDRRNMLQWVIGEREIELVPNNAIGARWG